MSTYVMSDIHGCYDELVQLLEKIRFSPKDTLIIAGDYMDRGRRNLEMLDWISDVPDNVILLKGNHDAEFVEYVKLLDALRIDYDLDENSSEDTRKLYKEAKLLASGSQQIYDYYGTIRKLIYERGVCLDRLKKWSNILDALPYIFEDNINDKHFVVVHAGYVEKDRLFGSLSVEDFYLYARDEAYLKGGKKDSVIVAGHTPTISPGHEMYTGGKIYRRYNEALNCTYYDIDSGIVFRNTLGEGNMACLRLDDEKEFYLYED